jgi:hypothetical protein
MTNLLWIATAVACCGIVVALVVRPRGSNSVPQTEPTPRRPAWK